MRARRGSEVAGAIAARKPRFVLLTAWGTSGNAGLCAKYLLEILPLRLLAYEVTSPAVRARTRRG